MDIELFVIIFAGVLSTTVAIIAKVNGDRKQAKYEKSQDSLSKSQTVLTETQSKLLSLYQGNKEKTDTIVDLQMRNQIITNNIVDIQKELQNKTEEVARLSKDIIESQTEIIAESDREKNPLFPMSVEIDISIPFSSNELGEKFIVALYKLKTVIENNELRDKKDINITYNSDGKIKSIKVYKNNEILKLIQPIPVFKKKRVDIALQKEKKYKLNGLKDPIFSFFASLDPMYSLGGGGYIEINYETRQLIFSISYSDVTIIEPRKNTSIGIIDLYNNYLVVEPKEINDYSITKLILSGKTEYSRYKVDIKLSEDEKNKLDNKVFFLHKIDENEIQIFKNFLLHKLH